MPRRNISSNQYLIQIIVVISYPLYCGVPVFKYSQKKDCTQAVHWPFLLPGESKKSFGVWRAVE